MRGYFASFFFFDLCLEKHSSAVSSLKSGAECFVPTCKLSASCSKNLAGCHCRGKGGDGGWIAASILRAKTNQTQPHFTALVFPLTGASLQQPLEYQVVLSGDTSSILTA